MTTFGAFALILTLAYIVYYAINISWDLYKAREIEPKEEEIIDVSDMVEKEPMPIGGEFVQPVEEVINSQEEVSQEETPTSQKSQEPPQNNEPSSSETKEESQENKESFSDAPSELEPVARHINEEMASEPAQPRHWEDYTDEELVLLVANNPKNLSEFYKTAEDVEKRDTNLL